MPSYCLEIWQHTTDNQEKHGRGVRGKGAFLGVRIMVLFLNYKKAYLEEYGNSHSALLPNVYDEKLFNHYNSCISPPFHMLLVELPPCLLAIVAFPTILLLKEIVQLWLVQWRNL